MIDYEKVMNSREFKNLVKKFAPLRRKIRKAVKSATKNPITLEKAIAQINSFKSNKDQTANSKTPSL